MAASDIDILRDRAHIPTKKSLLELTSQDALLAQNKLLSKQLEALTETLEETLAQFMQVSMSNQKSTESAIKNLEVQVGQLAKQLMDRSLSSFIANTEKNPKEECKAVMTRSRMTIHVDESEAKKKMEEHKQ
ncbi:hypothetical protein GmHk_10G029149 [Glycine max]|nr:hypothetical protein GmHk_10G029149 [Glycine max]